MIPGLNLELSSEQEEAISNFIKENYLSKRFYKRLEETNEKLSDQVEEYELLKKELSDQKTNFETLQKKYDALKESSKKDKDSFDASIKKIKIDYAINDRLTKEGAKNVKIILPLLEYDKLALDDSGQLTGLEDQIKNLKSSKDTNFLFHEDTFQSDTDGLTQQSSSPFEAKKAVPQKDPEDEKLNQYVRSIHPDYFSSDK